MLFWMVLYWLYGFVGFVLCCCWGFFFSLLYIFSFPVPIAFPLARAGPDVPIPPKSFLPGPAGCAATRLWPGGSCPPPCLNLGTWPRDPLRV